MWRPGLFAGGKGRKARLPARRLAGGRFASRAGYCARGVGVQHGSLQPGSPSVLTSGLAVAHFRMRL